MPAGTLTHLLLKRFDVVGVDVSVSQGVNKVSRLKGQKKKTRQLPTIHTATKPKL